MASAFDLVLINGLFESENSQDHSERVARFLSYLPNARVKIFDFIPHSTTNDLTQAWLRRRATELLVELHHERQRVQIKNNDGDDVLRPIVFLAHDLGGSLVKQALLLAAESPMYRSIARNTTALFFFGTPHRVYDRLSWEYTILHLLLLAKPQEPNILDLLHTLPDTMSCVAERFFAIAEKYSIVNFYETIPMLGSMVVDKYSATLDLPGEEQIGVDCDHGSLWRFSDHESRWDLVCRSIMLRSNAEVLIRDSSYNDFLAALPQADSDTHRIRSAKVTFGSLDEVSLHPSYRSWLERKGPSILNIHGPPGSGSTLLCSNILKNLKVTQLSTPITVTSFSFNSNDIRCNSTMSLYLALSRQLLSHRPSRFRHVKKLCQLMIKQLSFTENELWILVRALLSFPTTESIFCIIDGVDRCGPTAHHLIHRLAALTSTTQTALKILLTSRQPIEVNVEMELLSTIGIYDDEQMAMAMRLINRASISRLAQKQPGWRQFEDNLATQLCGSTTTHLVAALTLQLVENTQMCSDESILQELKSLPRDCFEIYRRALQRVPPNCRPWARSVLTWILHAVRPLSTRELAVATTLDGKKTSTTLIEARVSWDISKDLDRALGFLINIVHDEVYFVHDTFRDFLLQTSSNFREEWYAFEQYGHADITGFCLDYISTCSQEDHVSLETSADLSQLSRPLNKVFWLSNYAVQYWPVHCGFSQRYTTLTLRVLEFLEDSRQVKWWSDMYKSLGGPHLERNLTIDDPLSVASRFGLVAVVELLLSRSNEPEPRQRHKLQIALDLAAENGHTTVLRELLKAGALSQEALGLAARHGHFQSVEELLKSRADTDVRAKDGSTPLHQASRMGHVAIVKELLQRGAAVSAVDAHGFSPLHLAAQSGHSSLVQTLLEKGAPIPVYDGEKLTPLQLAAEEGFLDVVKELLQSDVDVNAETDEKLSALHLAVAHGDVAIVREILNLSAGALVNARNNGVAPILLASAEGHLPIVRELIRVGADPNIKSQKNMSSLQLAAQEGHLKVIKELLENNANPQMDTLPAFHFAAAGGHLEVVQHLSSTKIDTNATDESGFTALHLAAGRGHVEVMEELLKLGYDVNAMSEERYTPLHQAALKGHWPIVRTLIRAEAEIEIRSLNGSSPLHLASKGGHPVAVRELLSAGADMLAMDEEDHTPLHLAAQYGHLGVIKVFLESGFDSNLVDEDVDDTPLDSAAGAGHAEIVELLLKAGLKCDHRGENGKTALHVAAAQGHTSTVHILIEKGAKFDAADDDGTTPLLLAADKSYMGVLTELLEAGATVNVKDNEGNTPLFLAARNGNDKAVELLLSRNAEVNQKSWNGWTPLHGAHDHEEITKTLLRFKADVHARNNYDSTPLILAAQDGCEVVVQLLLDAGADPNARNKTYSSALHRAAQNGHSSVVTKLLCKGADINSRKKDGVTPLILASIYDGNEPMTRILVSHGADINAQGGPYGPALQAAAWWRQTEIARYLIESGAKINVTGGRFGTALNAAIQDGKMETIKLLLESGADPNIRDQTHKTALMIAAIQDKEQIVKVLLSSGADPGREDGLQRSELYWAAWYATLDSFNVIVEAIRSKPYAKAHLGSALHAAVARNSPDILSKLLEEGVDPDYIDRHGWSPLYCARQYQLKNIEEMLLTAGAVNEVPTVEQPSGWEEYDKAACLIVLDNGQAAIVGESNMNPYNYDQPRGTIRANHCMTRHLGAGPDHGVYYFEVEIFKGGESKIIGVGFGEEKFDLYRMPGWDPGSWGYHGDDGCSFDESGSGKTYGPTFDEGDIIGCGVNFERGTAFFTKNGKMLGDAFENIRGKLYPMVGFDTEMAGAHISVNFGDKDFRYQGLFTDTVKKAVKSEQDVDEDDVDVDDQDEEEGMGK